MQTTFVSHEERKKKERGKIIRLLFSFLMSVLIHFDFTTSYLIFIQYKYILNSSPSSCSTQQISWDFYDHWFDHWISPHTKKKKKKRSLLNHLNRFCRLISKFQTKLNAIFTKNAIVIMQTNSIVSHCHRKVSVHIQLDPL